jgi:hypothetical protein
MTFRQLWRKMIKMKTRSQLLTLRSGTQQSGAAFGNSPTKQAKLKKKGFFSTSAGGLGFTQKNMFFSGSMLILGEGNLFQRNNMHRTCHYDYIILSTIGEF